MIFSRMGIDPSEWGAPAGEFLSGQDTLFIRPAMYRALRPRLRPYVVGEMPWDVIYTERPSYALQRRAGEPGRRLPACGPRDLSGCTRRSRRTRGVSPTWTGPTSRGGTATTIRAKAMREAGRPPVLEEDALRDSVFGDLTLAERGKNLYRRLRHGGLSGARVLSGPGEGGRPLRVAIDLTQVDNQTLGSGQFRYVGRPRQRAVRALDGGC